MTEVGLIPALERPRWQPACPWGDRREAEVVVGVTEGTILLS